MIDNSYKILFSKIPSEAPSQGLLNRIDQQINRSRILQSRIRAVMFITFSCVAIIACIPIIQNMITAMTNSGFSTYMSLLVSDGGYIMSSWKEFGMTLAESFPVLGATAVIATALVFTYSLSRSLFYLKTIKTGNHPLKTYQHA